MTIYDAIKSRTAEKPFITRTTWVVDYGPWVLYGVRILPANTPDCCMIQNRYGGSTKTPAARWQPTAADLVAEDWVITD